MDEDEAAMAITADDLPEVDHWNYRLVYEDDEWGIFEVYYTIDGSIVARTENPVAFTGDDPHEVFVSMLQALSDAFTRRPLVYTKTGHAEGQHLKIV